MTLNGLQKYVDTFCERCNLDRNPSTLFEEISTNLNSLKKSIDEGTRGSMFILICKILFELTRLSNALDVNLEKGFTLSSTLLHKKYIKSGPKYRFRLNVHDFEKDTCLESISYNTNEISDIIKSLKDVERKLDENVL